MLGVPERYKQSEKIHIKTFITRDLSKVEKKRFLDAVIAVMLLGIVFSLSQFGIACWCKLCK